MNTAVTSPLEAFTSTLPPRARILLASPIPDEEQVRRKFSQQDLEVKLLDEDLRMISLEKENTDGIWWNEDRTGAFKIEECQRVLAIFFQALKPKTGKLAFRFSPLQKSPYTETQIEPLLRQTGFQIVSRWENDKSVLLITQRI